MKLSEKQCGHPNEDPYRCDCPNDCPCRNATCKGDFNGGFGIEDLDMKAALRERDTPRELPRSNVHVNKIVLEKCERCGKSSENPIWQMICPECKDFPIEDFPILTQILINLTHSLNHYGIINWFLKPHPILQGRTPSCAIDEGDIRDVLALSKGDL